MCPPQAFKKEEPSRSAPSTFPAYGSGRGCCCGGRGGPSFGWCGRPGPRSRWLEGDRVPTSPHVVCVEKKCSQKEAKSGCRFILFLFRPPPSVPPRWACVKIVATPEWVVFPLVAQGDRVPLKHTKKETHGVPYSKTHPQIEAC